jgi:Rieske Fe-S protein
MKKLSRRDFLKIASRGLLGLSGILGIGGLIRYLSFEPDPPPPQRFDVGKEQDFPVNSRTLLKQIPALLIRSADGFTALSLTCPHLGCTVEEKDGEMLCPCHGSRYTLEGQLLAGPATLGLKELKVEFGSDGNITILKG